MIKGQMSIFDFIDDPNEETIKQITIDKPIRLIELFAGYGSQAMALKRIGANFKHWFVCEFCKYACKSYSAVHGVNVEPVDIRDVKGKDLNIVDTNAFTYLLTYSFPCTDLSVAGKMAGMSRDSGTRSGLLWEVERLLKEIISDGGELPQILFMENVPQVHSTTRKKKKDEKGNIMYDEEGNIIYEKSNYENFKEWIDFLSSIGYTSKYKDLNSKHFGVPQNRNRTFMISFLDQDAKNYEFPKEIELTKTMADYLEDEVDRKYYITSEKAAELVKKLVIGGKILTNERTNERTIGTTHYPHGWLEENASFNGVCPTIDSGIWKHHTLLLEVERKNIDG